jgi:IMP dehydrogenase
MNEALTFDDVLIVPKFSDVESRKDVDLSFNAHGYPYMALPILSANMDSVTTQGMANTMLAHGAQACLHRFCSIEENVEMFKNSIYGSFDCKQEPFVSIGLGDKELDRARALFDAGARYFIIDVANGAQMSVVGQVKKLRHSLGDIPLIVVGNFASTEGVLDFMFHSGQLIDGLKIGIGPGSSCSTRVKTGCGYPQLSAILEISRALKSKNIEVPLIADGGLKTPGDCAKALAAGASMLMSGSFFAGTDESPGTEYYINSNGDAILPELFLARDKNDNLIRDEYSESFKRVKKYRGSASQESYEAQGKTGKHRTSEGESFLVPYKGSVKNILQDIEGGLRSAFTYVGAKNLKEFQEKAEFVRVTNAGYVEGTPYGKK